MANGDVKMVFRIPKTIAANMKNEEATKVGKREAMNPKMTMTEKTWGVVAAPCRRAAA